MAPKKSATVSTRKKYRRIAKDKAGGPKFYHEHTAALRNEKGEGVVEKASVKKTKAEPKKPEPNKTSPKKAAPKKAAPKKAAPKKAGPKKVAPKKVVPKKAAPKKAAPKRAAPKKAVAKKTRSPLNKTKGGRVSKSSLHLTDSSEFDVESVHTPTQKKRAAPRTPSDRKTPSKSPGSAKTKTPSKSSAKSPTKLSTKTPVKAPSVFSDENSFERGTVCY